MHAQIMNCLVSEAKENSEDIATERTMAANVVRKLLAGILKSENHFKGLDTSLGKN